MKETYMDEQALLDGLFAFLDGSVSPFHAAAAACRLLEEAGYTLCPESQPWKLEAGGRYYTTRNGTAVLAWRMPRGKLAGWHVTASHGDSPTWRLKVADIAEGGYLKAETEGYGGMIASTWLDRPLSVAGRLLVRTAAGVETRLVAPDRALLCIPNLCIHFDREANTGKAWNYQVDLQPICGLDGGARLMEVLAAEAGAAAEDILAHDLVLCTRQKAERVGVSGELFMSGRIDDLECAYTTLQGFLAGRGEEEGRADVWCMGAGGQPGRERPRPGQQPAAQRRQRPRHPPQPPRKERPPQSGQAGRRRPAQVQRQPDLHHQRPDRRGFPAHLRQSRGGGADLCQPGRRPGRLDPGQPAGPPDRHPDGGHRPGPAGHALGGGDGQLRRRRGHGQSLRPIKRLIPNGYECGDQVMDPVRHPAFQGSNDSGEEGFCLDDHGSLASIKSLR